MKLTPFEFQIYQRLKQVPIEGQRILVACSGGADSVALVHLLSRIAPKLRCRFGIAHVHHGVDEGKFRDQALEVARDCARTLKVEFHLARYRGERPLNSEAELREFRMSMLETIKTEKEYSLIAFAHHADDLFETRLIRLLRGTGPQGLQAMELASERILRPLLETSRAGLREYARSKDLRWVEDPSNASLDPFRNWLRLDLLPSLEAKRPGSSRAFARSLDAIVEMCSTAFLDSRSHLNENFLNRVQYNVWSEPERRQALATLLLKSGAKSFGRTHIEEIRKRIEVPQKVLQFSLLGLQFQINAEQIFISNLRVADV